MALLQMSKINKKINELLQCTILKDSYINTSSWYNEASSPRIQTKPILSLYNVNSIYLGGRCLEYTPLPSRDTLIQNLLRFYRKQNET